MVANLRENFFSHWCIIQKIKKDEIQIVQNR